MKSRVKTRQVREIWSQQFEHKQVLKRGTEPWIQKYVYASHVSSPYLKKTFLNGFLRIHCKINYVLSVFDLQFMVAGRLGGVTVLVPPRVVVAQSTVPGHAPIRHRYTMATTAQARRLLLPPAIRIIVQVRDAFQ